MANHASLFLLFIALSLIPSIKCVNSTSSTCFPEDYSRFTSECADSSRTVSYAKARNCVDPFPIPSSSTESCVCTPEDYVANYTFNSKNACELVYIPQKCTGGKQSEPIEVDSTFCEIEKLSPCKESNIRSTYTQCEMLPDKVTNGQTISTMKIIYYFDDDCNAESASSVKLPPVNFVSCGRVCKTGYFLSRGKCKQCPAGTFSVGDGLKLDSFTKLDPSIFKTKCSYTSENGTHTCSPWNVSNGVLKTGPYDSPNSYYPDQCASKDCHNNLKSSLTMTVKLIRDGFVTFNYSVNAEKNFDGLSFYIDVSDTPDLYLESYKYPVAQVTFNLTQGYHTLTWVYSKNEIQTQGSDSATISYIYVDGTEINENVCLPCPAGHYSDVASSSCTPCPVNTFSNIEGSKKCISCSEGTYSLNQPRIECIQKTTCNVTLDAMVSYSPCIAGKNTRTKKYKWLKPHICEPSDADPLPIPQQVPCAPCSDGFVPVENKKKKILECVSCPPETVRKDKEVVCHACGNGQVAVRVLSLSQFQLSDEKLPSEFITGCMGDCLTNGWRVKNGYFDTAVLGGPTKEVWLALNVTLQMDQYFSFVFSIDAPLDDDDRDFVVYVDDQPRFSLLFMMANDKDFQYSGIMNEKIEYSINLESGNHSILFIFGTLNTTDSNSYSGIATLYDLKVVSEVRGGGAKCVNIPEGATSAKSGDHWIFCPAGTFSPGGNSSCIDCPANSYGFLDYDDIARCEKCQPGTSSLPGSTVCMVGDVTIPSSYCTFSPENSNTAENDKNASSILLFNLSPLDRFQSDMYGPIYANSSSAKREDESQYFLSVCSKRMGKCKDALGKDYSTYMCALRPKTSWESLRWAKDIGESVSVHALSNNSIINKRGLLFKYSGYSCGYQETLATADVAFICDPDSGYGQAEAWTVKGKKKVFDPRSSPPFTDRKGKALSIHDPSDACHYSLVWYSAYACPLCTMNDYDAVTLQGCPANIHTTYHYKSPKMCQSNPQIPLPSDILCSACSKNDYETVESTCMDRDGRTNKTYRWRQPKTCNDNTKGADHLPSDITVGLCTQNVTVNAPLLNPLTIAVLVLAGLMVVGFVCLSVILWLRHKRLYSAYSKLLVSENLGDFSLESGAYQVDSDGGKSERSEES